MKICLVLEGSYPYINGGVSSWMHNYIKGMPEHEFHLWVIGAKSTSRGKFVYELPENVTGVTEVFLDDALKVKSSQRWNVKFSDYEIEQLEKLMNCGRPDWDVIFELCQVRQINPMAFLQSEDFLKILIDLCQKEYPYIAFSDAFHTIRSMLLPVFYLLSQEVPKADMYHSICTGYGGMIACLGSYINKCPVVLTEHGIYTREREEEIIRANWVQTAFKQQWINFFYMLSDIIYKRAFKVTSLFSRARGIQIDLGCKANDCYVIANGVDYKTLSQIPPKKEDGFINIGAVIRIAPIKDVKTMIYAFYELTERVKNVRLYIMGGVDDQEYSEECHALVRQMGTDSIIFTGYVNVREYMEIMDFTILSSISEGQPLSVLESFAAGRPAVTTEVGCCRQLIDGDENDDLGQAGYCVPPMCREELTDAMERMCASKSRREKMGLVAKQRVEKYYQHPVMLENYKNLYREVEEHIGRSGI